ncbi:nucleotide sugar dehydrogenase [Methanoregula formicica]|uniref:UDP-N-acetyl-D-mannosamine dehydrogenase n=1 Tax=Methanoregula formicica (strain DSM 22288 / NBRC 105244 / SMSP) TaxID=593750 RepID=L0HDX4_METFS|nr:nucleotide sugar dehydrogenase [Methanoregula formicica]AGB02190.1 nucleotide sugar dehydrogenase [Methanoregula formicica SMSP]
MAEPSITNKTVCIVGLGYVGLPLAEAFSRHVRTMGYDIDERKVKGLQKTAPGINATSDPARIRDADFIMICVPTLLTPENDPDLSYIRGAAKTVGANLKKGAVVILESTVYPGVTEEVLLPVLEDASGFAAGKDFAVGYSPERINPGDDEHALSRTTKIVAGMDPATTSRMAGIYGLITKVYCAPDIRTAEAAKVVENIQRDINIALTNEFSQMFPKLGLNTKNVLEAAGTKWNFHHYTPGIVGGHCIPTVPHFLAYAARRQGFHPRMILAGRATNDQMIPFIADLVTGNLAAVKKGTAGPAVAVLGLTYKENVPDYRDNPVFDLIGVLTERGIRVFGYDPLLTKDEITRLGVTPLDDIGQQMDGYILAAPHNQFIAMADREFAAVAGPGILFVDIKGVFHRNARMRSQFRYITL